MDLHAHIHWCIIGGESGHKARRFDVQWALDLIDQCRSADVTVFVKQLGAHIIDRNDVGFQADCDVWAEGPDKGLPTEPRAWPESGLVDVEENINGFREEYQGAPVRVHLRNKMGGDPAEWPLDLRVREFPQPASRGLQLEAPHV